MPKGKKRRVPLPLKIVLGAVAVLIIAGGAVLGKLWYEQGRMNPLATGQVIPGVYAINNGIVNCYLIEGADGYILIDAGADAKQTADVLNTLAVPHGLITAVLLTHSDYDHTAALSLFPVARIYLSEAEADMLSGGNPRGSKLSYAYDTLSHGQSIDIAGVTVECISTPGHTPGSMCYLIDGKYLFTGDTMSLIDGKAALFNSFYNMDDAEQERSIRMLADAYAPTHIFTAHYGYTDNAAVALAGWRD